MKLVARTLAILAVALVVAGIAFTLAQSSYVQGLLPPMPDRAAQQGAPVAAEGLATHDRPDRAEGGLASMAELLKNLAIVAATVVMIWPVRWLLYRRRTGKPKRRAPGPPIATRARSTAQPR